MYVNDSLRCTSADSEDGDIMVLNDSSASNISSRMRLGSLTCAEVGINGLLLSVGGPTKVDSLEVDNNILFDADTIKSTNFSGVETIQNTTDVCNVFQVKSAQGCIRMRSFNILAYNTSADSPNLPFLNRVFTGGVYCLNLGIGAIAGANRLNVA